MSKMTSIELTLSDYNRASMPESTEDLTIREKCRKFMQKHDRYHPSRQCLQCLGNHPMGDSSTQDAGFELFTLNNPDFLALFADGSIGYIACRTIPNGNGIKRFGRPVVWEVKNGHVGSPKSAHCADYGMYIEPGDVAYTFFWEDFTLKQPNKMVLDGIWH
jgi:hypothetical protein